MRPIKILFAAAALAAVVSTSAQASEYRTFKHEGVTYTYRIIEKGDRQIILGTSETLGETKKFRLVVRNGQVRGDVADSRVAFSTSEASKQRVLLAAD